MSDSEGGSCFAIVVIVAIGLIMMMLNKCGGSSNSIDNVRGRRAEVVLTPRTSYVSSIPHTYVLECACYRRIGRHY